MRIVAGRLRGRALGAPAGALTRPTSDRLREAIFNVLAHGDYPLAGTRVLDLFAGSGALGLEALSRGATFALFIEERAAARAAIRANIETLGLEGATKIFRRDATHLGAMPPRAGGPFELVFLDPPYGKGLVRPALEGLRKGGWLAAAALCVIEMGADEPLLLPDGFTEADSRRHGHTRVVFARCTRFKAE
jgi:16S rRNA (guanine966-N2)-methyltransferase